MNNKKTITNIFAGIILVLTIILYIIGVKSITFYTNVGISILLIAEVLFFVIYNFLNASKKDVSIAKAKIFSTYIIFLLITLLVSLALIFFGKPVYKLCVSLEITFFAIFIVVVIMFKSASKRTNVGTEKMVKARDINNNVIDKAKEIRDNNKDYYKELNKIYEDIRYGDNSIYVYATNEISKKLDELKILMSSTENKNKDKKIKENMSEITLLITKRNSQIEKAK